MADLALAYDLGTGGCKASLWDADARLRAETVVPYGTHHPAPGRNEQRPADWWDAVVRATRELFDTPGADPADVAGIALSGHSLGIVQVDGAGELVSERTPLWSDARGRTEQVFAAVEEAEWYRRTGNGFGAPLYPLFKSVTLRAEDPEAWARTRHLLGSKDWINLRLTGRMATDHSMASGSGAYSLAAGAYDPELLDAAGLDPALLPAPREAHHELGPLTRHAAAELGLRAGIPVFTGAVDNAAMAVGSRGTAEGRIYAALGSSSWITVTSASPVLHEHARPYVFRHAVPGFHISALSTFSSGTSLEWLRGIVAPDLELSAVIDLAAESAPGARGVAFAPTLAGGTPLEGGSAARGVVTGLELGTARSDLVRACLEGIAFSLDRSLTLMRSLSGTTEDLLISGGGSRSEVWNRIYADILRTPLLRTRVDQQAAALGAATIAFVGLGVWDGYTRADQAHRDIDRYDPLDPAAYDLARERFAAAVRAASA
ncbi:xylulokinase [Microbacterium sp. MC2]